MAMKMCAKRKAEHHFDYLHQNKKLPALKNHGHLQTAQHTTTKRTNINTKKLLRWHGVITFVLLELDRLNSWHPEWSRIKAMLLDYFLGNLDEANMSASCGTVRIVGSADIKKHEMNMDDNHERLQSFVLVWRLVLKAHAPSSQKGKGPSTKHSTTLKNITGVPPVLLL